VKTRLTSQTLQVLAEFLQSPADWKYGYDISRNTKLKPGSLYPMLMRLEDRGLLEAQWENPEPGRPPRHMYRLTSVGLQYARQSVSTRSRVARMHPALGGVKN
jgi:PadR family transcriptional regulator, regulatory protein PadR